MNNLTAFLFLIGIVITAFAIRILIARRQEKQRLKLLGEETE